MTLTRAELSEHLFKSLGINKHVARNLVGLFFEEICALLEQGQQIRLANFGNFNLRDKKARPGRNPKTGKDATIPSRRVVTFNAGRKLKTRINNAIAS